MLAMLKRLARNLAQGKATMAAIPPVCNFGEKAHAFTLPATDGRTYASPTSRGPRAP